MADFDTRSALAQQLEATVGVPLLFVGSGLTRRYLGTPTWDALLKLFASKFLPHPYDYYKSKADNDLPQTASHMANDLHELWWKNDNFKELRAEHQDKNLLKQDPFKICLARLVADCKFIPGKDATHDAEVALLRTIKVASIVTTNWDSFLEEQFPAFDRRIGTTEILFSSFDSLAEIYKIHGSSDLPESLVITKEDYDSFGQKRPFVSAKLLTFFVEHPVIFLGYSVSDENIQRIIADVFSSIDIKQVKELQRRLVLIQHESEKNNWSSGEAFIQAGPQKVPVTIIRTDDYVGTFRALSEARVRFPVKVLRVLKDHVYELVHESKPTGGLAVVDLEDATHLDKIDVVIGVGLQSKIGIKGYQPITRQDLLFDVVENGKSYDPVGIVQDVLPRLKTGRNRYVPVFKYVKGGDFAPFGAKPIPPKFKLPSGLASFVPPEQIVRVYSSRASKLGSFEKIAAEPPEEAVFLFLAFDSVGQNVEVLREFLARNLKSLLASARPNVATYAGALVCLYDFLAFGAISPPPLPVMAKRDVPLPKVEPPILKLK